MSLSLANRKTTQALAYFARQAGGKINKMKGLKLLFFADRYHLRKFGRPVSDAHYFAMKNGPVASEAKNVAELVNLRPEDASYVVRFLQRESHLIYGSTGDFELAVFSESDLEAIHFAWEKFGPYDQFQLSKLTHRYPEWRKHARALQDGARRVKMDYLDFFQEPKGDADPCYPLTAEERAAAVEIFHEEQSFAAHWH